MNYQDVVEHHMMQSLPRTAPRRAVEPTPTDFSNTLRTQMMTTAATSVAAVSLVITCFWSAIA